MNIFLENSYQTILRQVVDERKRIDSKFNFQAIADSTRIPKSYISRVTTAKAHFSADQLYMIADFLGFNELQKRYVTLLLEHERSTVKKRKDAIRLELEQLREQALESKEHLEAKIEALSEEHLREYFLDPINQVVHICLSIQRYQTDPQQLATDLGISATELGEVITSLEKLGIIEVRADRIKTLIKSVHLPRNSASFRPWRNQMKLMALERLNRRPQKQDYSFSVSFSATEKVREKIKADFLALLKNTESSVLDSKQEEAYQMTFDLFSWTKR